MTYFLNTCFKRYLQFGIKMSWAVNGQAAYKGRSKAAPARVVLGMKSTGTKSVNRGENNAITVKKSGSYQ